jgi:hypothetical protein
MDFYERAPNAAIDALCIVCGVEVLAHEPVFMAVDKADDTGTQIHVEHETCHINVEIARAQVYVDAAKSLLASESEAAAVLNSRAKRIQRRVDEHQAQRRVA